MNLKDDFGLEIFEQWLGYSLGKKRKLIKKNSQEEFHLIHDSLYNPPNENLTGPSLKYSSPWVDNIFMDICLRYDLSPIKFWPNSAPYAVCLTHDVDRIFATLQRVKHGASFLQIIQDCWTSLNKKHWHRNAFYNFARLSSLHEELHIKSAIFLLLEKKRWLKALRNNEPQHVIGVYKLEEIKNEIERLYSAGCEIGIHGSFDSWNDSSQLKYEIECLKKLGVFKVFGGRNHYLQFDLNKTAEAFEMSGLSYDSSMGFNFSNGFRVGTSFPYYWKNIVEIPLHLMDTSLWYECSSQEKRVDRVRDIHRKVKSVGGLLMLNWHLQYVNQEEFAEQYQLFKGLLEEAIADGAWVCLPKQVAEIWKSRSFFRSEL